MCCLKTYPLPLAAMSLLLPDTLLAELYSIRQVCATLFCILLSTLSTSRLLLMLESDSQYVLLFPSLGGVQNKNGTSSVTLINYTFSISNYRKSTMNSKHL